jgi:hypothetical protein
MGSDAPPIDEIVNLLDKLAPEELIAFRERLPPDMRPLFVPGGIAGKADQPLNESAELAARTLRTLVKQCDRWADAVGQRLRHARRLHMVGDVMAVVGSSSVLGTIAASLSVGVYVSGFVALLGSVTSLIADHVAKLPEGGPSSMFNVYSQLTGGRHRAKQLLDALNSHLRTGIPKGGHDEVTGLIGQSNELSKELVPVTNALVWVDVSRRTRKSRIAKGVG